MIGNNSLFIFKYQLGNKIGFIYKYLFLLLYVNIYYIYNGDWGLGIGDWAQSPIPNPQSPIPNPQILNLIFK